MSAQQVQSDIWQGLETIQTQVNLLASAGGGDVELAGAVVDGLVNSRSTLLARVWRRTAATTTVLASAGGLPADVEDLRGADLDTVIQSERPRVLRGSGTRTTSQVRWIAVPFRLRSDESLLLDLAFPADPIENDAVVAATVDFSCALCELLGIHILRVDVARLANRARQDEATSTSLLQLHSAVGQTDSSTPLAAALQAILDCGRAWLFEVFPGGVAMRGSTLNDVEQHAHGQSLALRRLAEAVAASGTGFQMAVGDSLESAGPIKQLAREYLDAAQLRLVRVEPLFGDEPARHVTAVLVLDRYTLPVNQSRDVEQDRLILGNAEAAWNNSQQIGGGFWRSTWRTTKRLLGRRKFTWIVGGAALVLAFLAFVPWTLEIRADGRLQPAGRRGIFTPADGIVSELLVEDGARVAAGDLVLILRSPELDAERGRVLGELTTKQTRHASLLAARSQARAGRDSLPSNLAAEIEELGVAIAGLEKQLTLLDERIGALRLVSPISGQIDRWNLDQTLAGRPVARGQELLRVLDIEGPWQLELRIAEDESAHVTSAQRANDRLSVRFQFRTEPGATREGTLQMLSDRTEIDDRGGLWLRGIVPLEDPSVSRRAGAGVTARIDCGQRSIGFVWLRQLMEFAWRRWWV
ncbi:MAG: HlyD family efflux transporter periplasmic adaptor subunit [Planctomycetota bacterium]|nr:HlyD family efflux transporter periplasmic adaptor subunit [Planctomycetota bacterium]